MEQKENLEKPEWVVEIEQLLPSSRQNVGTICASTIQNLGCIYGISSRLYYAVIDAVDSEIAKSVNDDAESFAKDIVEDAKSQK